MSGEKGRAAARQAVKNWRRAIRKGTVTHGPGGPKVQPRTKRWMRDKPMMKTGNGGTDKSGSRKKSIVYYSDKPARR